MHTVDFDLDVFVAMFEPFKAHDHKAVGRAILKMCPEELQETAAARLGYSRGMTAEGRGWRIINPRQLMVPSVAVAIFSRERNHLVLEQRFESGEWGLPGGGMKFGENVRTAALREGQDETGLTINLDKLIAVYTDLETFGYTYPDQEQRQSIGFLIEAEIASGELQASVESLDVQWFDRDAIAELTLVNGHRKLVEFAFKPRSSWPVLF